MKEEEDNSESFLIRETLDYHKRCKTSDIRAYAMDRIDSVVLPFHRQAMSARVEYALASGSTARKVDYEALRFISATMSNAETLIRHVCAATTSDEVLGIDPEVMAWPKQP